jgi:hypothetical protein
MALSGFRYQQRSPIVALASTIAHGPEGLADIRG